MFVQSSVVLFPPSCWQKPKALFGPSVVRELERPESFMRVEAVIKDRLEPGTLHYALGLSRAAEGALSALKRSRS